MNGAKRHPLDRPSARVVAAFVFAGALAALAYIHRDDLMPAKSAAVAVQADPVQQCIAKRAADIDAMVKDSTITTNQAELFKTRARALCQAQAQGKAPQ